MDKLNVMVDKKGLTLHESGLLNVFLIVVLVLILIQIYILSWVSQYSIIYNVPDIDEVRELEIKWGPIDK